MKVIATVEMWVLALRQLANRLVDRWASFCEGVVDSELEGYIQFTEELERQQRKLRRVLRLPQTKPFK